MGAPSPAHPDLQIEFGVHVYRYRFDLLAALHALGQEKNGRIAWLLRPSPIPSLRPGLGIQRHRGIATRL